MTVYRIRYEQVHDLDADGNPDGMIVNASADDRLVSNGIDGSLGFNYTTYTHRPPDTGFLGFGTTQDSTWRLWDIAYSTGAYTIYPHAVVNSTLGISWGIETTPDQTYVLLWGSGEVSVWNMGSKPLRMVQRDDNARDGAPRIRSGIGSVGMLSGIRIFTAGNSYW